MNSLQRIRKSKVAKVLSVFIAINMLTSLLPYQLFGLTSGPSQPEFDSFSSISTTEMVDLYSGDFNYNIPLLNVPGPNGGYPVNLNYSAGIKMEQEASWVGLGWNINTGSITRNLRGIPDDFSGEEVTQEITMKPDWTLAFSVKDLPALEVIGFEVTKYTSSEITGDLGIFYNSYRGIGLDVGIGYKSVASKEMQFLESGDAITSLGLNYNTQGGMDFKFNLSFNKKLGESDKEYSGSKVYGAGFNINSIQGLNDISLSQKKFDKKSDYKGTKSLSFSINHPIPPVQYSMANRFFSAKYSFGADQSLATTETAIDVSLNISHLKKNNYTHKAYGSLYSEDAPYSFDPSSEDYLLDFNRDGTTSISKDVPITPFPVNTYDVYSIMGEGIGGQFRVFRSDVGLFTQSPIESKGVSANAGYDAGVGTTNKAGGDIGGGYSSSYSGTWRNSAHQIYMYKFTNRSSDNPLFEPSYFKLLGETSISNSNLLNNINGEGPLAFDISGSVKGAVVKNSLNGKPADLSNKTRDARPTNIAYSTKLNENNSYTGTDKNQISKFRITKSNGATYEYGLAINNTLRKDVFFSVDDDVANPRTIGYSVTDASLSNNKGDDKYYKSVVTPSYAHTHLLTAIYSHDYIDVSNDGPTNDDLGGYTKFEYEANPINYKWRIPYRDANFSKGYVSKEGDEKASYTYGEKELNYLDKIVTKTHTAIFYKSDREDARGVYEEYNTSTSSFGASQKLLDSIVLYSNNDLINPIKTVHFEYNYSLCPKVLNSGATETGKLTLKKLWFSYKGNRKGNLSPYEFYYEVNLDYNMNKVDRWGNYKYFYRSTEDNKENPYFNQYSTDSEIGWIARMWNLSSVVLPSGGTLNIEYESDDYQYIQNKKAGFMAEIVGFSENSETYFDPTSNDYNKITNNQRRVYFKVPHNLESNQDVKKYIEGLDYLYFKVFMQIKPAGTFTEWSGDMQSDYVTGYAPILKTTGSYGIYSEGGVYDYSIAYITLDEVGYTNDLFKTNPLRKAGWQYLRYSRPDLLINEINFEASNNPVFFASKFATSIIKSAMDLSFGYYNSCAINGICKRLNFEDRISYLRLNVRDKKYGGGHRVKKLYISDNWADAKSYGQEYQYVNADGSSSGVAEYEPMTGGDENSLRKPIWYNENKNLIVTEELYKEEPIGESYFPSPKIGYSRVVVTNLIDEDVTQAQSGISVSEFYTSMDFPIIVDRYPDVVKWKGFNLPAIPIPILGTYQFKRNGFSQGFSIKLNDMAGRMKSVSVYNFVNNDISYNPGSNPVSSVIYKYKSTKLDSYSSELDNNAVVAREDGIVESAVIGVEYDFYIDLAENNSNSYNIGFEVDVEFSPNIMIIPTAFPDISYSSSLYRHVVTNKVIEVIT